jgi:hypothetical protein
MENWAITSKDGRGAGKRCSPAYIDRIFLPLALSLSTTTITKKKTKGEKEAKYILPLFLAARSIYT